MKIVVCISLLFVAALVAPNDAVINHISALRSAVLTGYDKMVKPEEKTTVNVGLRVINLSLCPHKQVYYYN
jgi:hypothetical protein